MANNNRANMCINNLGVVTVVKEGRSRIPISQQTSAIHGQPNPASQRTAIFWLSAMCTKNAFDHDWPVAGHADVLSGSSCFPHSLVLIMYQFSLRMHWLEISINISSWQIRVQLKGEECISASWCIFWFQQGTISIHGTVHFQPLRVDSTWKHAMFTSQSYISKPSTTDVFKDDLPGTPKDMVPTYGKLPVLFPYL